MEKARITVVTATFNRKRDLERCIASVLSQNVEGLVMHIFDNDSSDDTEEFMLSLIKNEGRIKYTRRPENIGGLANIAKAIASVETEYFVVLADDDYLLPGFLATALPILDSDPELGAVVMQTVHRQGDREIRCNPDERWTYGKLTPPALFKQWVEFGHFEWNSIVFRTSARDAIGGLDMEVGLPSDVDFQAQIFLKHPVFLYQQKAAVFSLHPGQNSRRIGLSEASGYARMVEKVREAASPEPGLAEMGKVFWNNCSSHIARMGWLCKNLMEISGLVKILLFRFKSPVKAAGAIARWLSGKLGLSPKIAR